MNPLKSIIIDDEQDSRDSLRAFVEKYCKDVQVLACCAGIREGQEAIARHRPDLVFLDIEMPYGNAFDLLEKIGEIDFEVVFVTAYSQYAIEALKLSAADYLLKPIDIDELVQAVEKVRERREQGEVVHQAQVIKDALSSLAAPGRRITLPLLNGFEVVDMADIVYCEAADNFTTFYLSDGSKQLICRKLKFYENLLEPYGFCRIHRSYIVNLDFVRRYLKGKGGFVVLREGKELPVAESRKKVFLGAMKRLK